MTTPRKPTKPHTRTQWEIYESCLREGWQIGTGILVLRKDDSVRVITPDGKSATVTPDDE